MIIADVLGIFGYGLQIYSLQIEFLLLGRLITGVVIGVSLGVIPSYLNSIAPPQMSGFICSLNQLFITIGIATAYAMAFRLRSGYEFEVTLFLLLPVLACVIRIISLKFFFP